MNQKIKNVFIGPMPMTLFDGLPSVHVEYDDGTQEKLFDFYPDEIMFKEEEIIGKTRSDVLALKTQKDIKYLQSK